VQPVIHSREHVHIDASNILQSGAEQTLRNQNADTAFLKWNLLLSVTSVYWCVPLVSHKSVMSDQIIHLVQFYNE